MDLAMNTINVYKAKQMSLTYALVYILKLLSYKLLEHKND
jgi:hypothetical protein